MSNDCFKIFDINLVEQATLTASSQNALFPISNIQDPRRSKVFRSTSNSANVILDFQESSEVNGIFFMADKRNGFGISAVTVEFNATSNFTSPAYSISVPLSTKFGIGYVELPAMISYRFARIVMTSALAYCELSNVFIGKNMDIERSMSFGWTYKNEELSLKQTNRYGQPFTDVILRQAAFGFALKNYNKEDSEKLQTLLDRVGESKPFYVIIGNDKMMVNFFRYSGPVQLQDIPTQTNSTFNKYNLSMNLKEVT